MRSTSNYQSENEWQKKNRVNRNTNISSIKLVNRWFSRYVITAMLVDGKQKIAH